MKIAFIGGGNMGEAMLSAILDKGLSSPQYVSVSDISQTRRQHLEQKYGVAVMSDNRMASVPSRHRIPSGHGGQLCLAGL